MLSHVVLYASEHGFEVSCRVVAVLIDQHSDILHRVVRERKVSIVVIKHGNKVSTTHQICLYRTVYFVHVLIDP